MAHRYRRNFASDPDHPEYFPPHHHPKYPRNDPSGSYMIDHFEGQLFTSILEDVIAKMGILMHIKSDYHVTKLQSQMNKLMARKYKVAESKLVTEMDLLEKVDPTHLDDKIYKLNKFENDRKYLINVITTLYIEIYMDHRFKSIVDSVKKVVSDEQYRIDLAEEELVLKVQRKDLYKQLRQQRNHIKTVLYDCKASIDTLKNKLEDLELTESIQGRYIDNWQEARTEQNTQSINDKESVYINLSEYFKTRSEQEARIHQDVDMLINIQINETLKQVEEWMNKYDADLEGIELKIQLKKIEFQDAKEKHSQLEQTLQTHEKEMLEWTSFKEERDRIRLYKEKMMESAIMVQAWWRGLLVRKMLGPYRLRKGKRAPKKILF